ncbi:MAG: KamA family radical SAM protein [Spirochaetes bacterium]|nr:KamA family radical SAM protein [Spirochaetota bacterium]
MQDQKILIAERSNEFSHETAKANLCEEYSDSDEPPSLSAFAETSELTYSPLLDTSFEILKEKCPARATSSPKTTIFRKNHYPHISRETWNDWKWQLQNRITNVEELSLILRLSEDEETVLRKAHHIFPFSITPYYASLLDIDDPAHPLRRTVIPSGAELVKSEGESDDPLDEENDSPVPGLVHRYPDRVLFLTTDFCSNYCRYCTRSRMVGRSSCSAFSKKNWEMSIAYIESHPEIRDVLLSGGDPLTLSDESLEWLLSSLRKISHIEIIRIGSKVPVVLPQRITSKLVKILKRYHPVWMNIHFTHPDEVTPEVEIACRKLSNAGIPLGSQTVLLKGINDDVEILRSLYHQLLKNRVRPYYLYQCDPISGSSHFRTRVEKGIEIIKGLRGFTTGFAVPNFVIDAPGGGGKIPLQPQYFQGVEGNTVMLRNYEDKLFTYPDTCTE